MHLTYKYGEACLPRIFCRLLNKCKPLFDYLYNIYMKYLKKGGDKYEP